MNQYDPKNHHRRSIRLKGYDYAQEGLYFITICVQNRECLFGKIENGIVILNDAGKMVERWYCELENKYPDKRCHQMVIMPNHIHCIIENMATDTIATGATDEMTMGALITMGAHTDMEIKGAHTGDMIIKGAHTGAPLPQCDATETGETDALAMDATDIMGATNVPVGAPLCGRPVKYHCPNEYHHPNQCDYPNECDYPNLLCTSHTTGETIVFDTIQTDATDIMQTDATDAIQTDATEIIATGEMNEIATGATDEMITGATDEMATDAMATDEMATDAIITKGVHTDIIIKGAHTGAPLPGKTEMMGAANAHACAPQQTNHALYGMHNKKHHATIGEAMDWFKTMTTNEYIRGIKQCGWQRFNGRLWQRNYWEHIIRDDQSHQRISDYINNNPAKWSDDKFYIQ